MTVIGQQITRGELLQRAVAYQASLLANSATPYKSELKAQNEQFVRTLQASPDGTLDEMRAHAQKRAASLGREAAVLGFAGLGVIIATATLPALSGPIAHAIGFGVGIYVGQVLSSQMAVEAGRQRVFAAQLTDWQASIDAQPPLQGADRAAQLGLQASGAWGSSCTVNRRASV